MKKSNHKAVAIVGIGAVMPDAPDLPSFWQNIKQGKYSISDVPESRWDPALYYDPDRGAPDKTYSRLGGWVKEDNWDPLKWRLPIPPKVGLHMDSTQKWAITAAREALLDFGIEEKDFNRDRTAVILGVAMGGDQHLYSATRIFYPEFERMLSMSPGFSGLPENLRKEIKSEMHAGLDGIYPAITEDTMPGELSNVVAGRIAALYNFHGPNYIADAACASAIAGMTAAIEGLEEYDYDLVVTGGIDANMSPTTFVKFSKIGALSATGTRPYAEGADGFIMGEGAAVFVLKRLDDAERDGDRIYAVIRSIGGSSDGKGKGITAPNPVGQVFAIRRGWEKANIPLGSVSMIEGHGTSTSVGDAVELKCLNDVFGGLGMGVGSVALGSVKSNIGHLKGAAGAAGIAKAAMALHEKVLPPSLNFHKPNPGFDFGKSPFRVNTELRPWNLKNGHPRRAGVSAFGFGGTNFHVVMEEYIPGRILSEERSMVAVASSGQEEASGSAAKAPLRGALVKGADNVDGLIVALEGIRSRVEGGWTPERKPPAKADLGAPCRIAIDFGDADELADRIGRAIKGLRSGSGSVWKPLNAKGIFYGEGPASKVAFLFTGQGSQYVNMLRDLRDTEPIVAETFKEADAVMTPLLGKPITEYIFMDPDDKEKVRAANKALMQTEITQPAVLTVDVALYRLMTAYGIAPDAVAGHSLGEYGALVASGAISFANALKVVSARGSQMAKVNVEDKGAMAAIFGSPEQIEAAIEKIDGYVVIANMNSYGQSVIGGGTDAVLAAMAACKEAGLHVAQLPVSHAFHTQIVADASKPLRKVLETCDMSAPKVPIIANITGDFYPTTGDVIPEMVEILSRQVASPVQFVKGINRLYNEGIRVFIEMGPKKALNGFVRDITADKEDVLNLFTNHPKVGDLQSFNQGLCGLYASGLGNGLEPETAPEPVKKADSASAGADLKASPAPAMERSASAPVPAPASTRGGNDRYERLGRLFVDFMDKARDVYQGGSGARPARDIWITGASLGLPKVDRVFDDRNVQRLLTGEQLITTIPKEIQRDMLAKNITRLVKTGKGGPRFETLAEIDEVIKLAARKENLDVGRDFGIPKNILAALDSTSELAIGAGIDALRDAGIPLVMQYKTTTTGSKLPDRWLLPEKMRDDTGIIFASAFPGYNAYAHEMQAFFENRARMEKLDLLKDVRDELSRQNGDSQVVRNLDQRIAQLQGSLDGDTYAFNRRFLLRVLSMGHAQFAQYIGARGPNTQVNSACASTTLAIGLSKDWIEAGRCKRVIIIAADDITSDETLDWFSSGFLAAGAAATDERVEDAALPFDRRRHGMIVGMGAVGIVVESREGAEARGMHPICEVLSTMTANSAFHGTRLDVDHIKFVMEKLIAQAEQQHGIDRREIAGQTVFVSHETYTPARGGSASAEINALRYVFGPDADKVVIANTKGMTGHAMAVGIEDVLAIKTLETGIVPPIPNFREVDPELGVLNLSKGGAYPVTYALRLGAGFGSQISMSLLRWTPAGQAARPEPDKLGYSYRVSDADKWKAWLKEISGRLDPEIEVVNRTLRVADPLGGTRQEPSEEGSGVKAGQPAARIKETPPAAEVVAAAGSGPDDRVGTVIMNLVSEKTGYPIDMLDPSLDLEADLGIDTVKQAELFAEVRGQFDIERDDQLQLSEFPTLNHIIRFVYDRKPELGQPASVPAGQAEPANPVAEKPADPILVDSGAGGDVQSRILALVAEKTGYPEDMLDLDLDLEADLGIDTVKQAELFAEVREAYGIERDDQLQLSEFPTLSHIIRFVYDRKPELSQPASPEPMPMKSPAPAAERPADASARENGAGGEVETRILQLVAEKTGYPEDMLELDLDLEADLGIDTVKQAELFAEVREGYGIERDDQLQLSEFPTLRHIIGFVHERRPDLGRASAPVVAASEETRVETSADQSTAADASGVQDKVLALVAEKTGYPVEMLELDLDLEADLGIDTVKQAELFAEVRGEYGIERDDELQLSEFPTLKHIIRFVHERRPDLDNATAPAAGLAETPPVEPSVDQSAIPAGDGVRDLVLALVAEKTGYPVEMLELDLDLEADLGIDTVKQAELFAEIRGAYGIERDDTIELSEFPTLNHIIQFVHDRRSTGDPSSGTEESESGDAVMDSVPSAEMEAIGPFPRRVPVPRLRPGTGYCKPSGVELAAGDQVLVMTEQGNVGKALVKELKKRGVGVHQLNGMDRDQLIGKVRELAGESTISGVFWLAAMDHEGDISKMTHADWKGIASQRVKLLYTAMRELILQDQADPFLVAGTRMGGRFGYDENGAQSPTGGAVSGFAKAYKREHPSAQVKVVDFEQSRKTTALAKRLVDEALYDPGVVEVGYQAGFRWTIGLEEVAMPVEKDVMELTSETVFLVTGAAGSITSAITADLAAASGGIFYLLDLAPAPRRDDPDLAMFSQDPEGLKRQIFERLKKAGERVTPVRVEKELGEIERASNALKAIHAIEEAGGTAQYYSLDLRDHEQVSKAVADIVQRAGVIDVLIHAAGLEISRLLPDKSPGEFDLVFDVKADGWYNLLSSLGDTPVGTAVVFSSIAGRFGNGGQADYSAANDFLCKSVSNFRTTRPGTRGIAIDWTAWADIGMAARGSIPAVMAQAGIDMLPPSIGIPFIRRELTGHSGSGEIVVAQSLGVMMEEFDVTGGLDAGDGSPLMKQISKTNELMVRNVEEMGLYSGLTVRSGFDPEKQGFLKDHQISGTAVLPGVMGVEAMVSASLVLFPDRHVIAVENIEFLAPFKFYRSEPRDVFVRVQYTTDRKDVMAHCSLIGKRRLLGQDHDEVTEHFMATVRLGKELPERPANVKTKLSPKKGAQVVGAADIYKVYFHGPAYQVIEKCWKGGKGMIGHYASDLPANHVPGDLKLVTMPRLLELGFQTAGILEMARADQMGLPSHIDNLMIFAQEGTDGNVYAVVKQTEEGYAFSVVDGQGGVLLEVRGYGTSVFMTGMDETLVAPLKAAAE